jgi:hypothetical protein
MYTLKIWHGNIQIEWRYGLPYSLARSLAIRAGYDKAQVICERTDVILLETKGPWGK